MRTLSTIFMGTICAAQMFGASGTDLALSKSLQSSLPQVNEALVRPNVLHSLKNSNFKAPLKAAETSEVIYEAPEGEAVNYSTAGTAYMAIMGYIGQIPVEDFVTEIVYCEDGSVYWKNSVTMIVANTYIKGKDEGDRLVFELPQAIVLNPDYPDEDGNPTYAYAQRMSYDQEAQFYYVTEGNNTVSLIKKEDGTLTADVDGNDIIGMTTPDGQWYGYGNYNTVLTPAGAEIAVTPPEGLKTEEWMLISDYQGRKVELGFDGNDVYFHNVVTPLFDDPGLIPDYWVKGTIQNDEIVIPKQYVGQSELLMFSVYFTPADMIDEETIEPFDEAVLKYDADSRTMTSDVGFSLTAGAGFVFGYTEMPVIRWQPEDFEINLPNPVIVDAFNYDDTINYGVFAFTLPALTKEGYALDPDYIFTRFYVDDEPYIFSPEDYDLEEPMEWVPFLFEDGWDFHQWGEYHRFDLYFDGADTMGVQAKYDDGKVSYYTDIVSVNLKTAVDNIKVEDSTSKDSEVYGINGLRYDIASLKPGIYVVRTADSVKKLVIK